MTNTTSNQAVRVIRHWAFIISVEMVTALAYASLHLCNLSAYLTNRLVDSKTTSKATPLEGGDDCKRSKM